MCLPSIYYYYYYYYYSVVELSRYLRNGYIMLYSFPDFSVFLCSAFFLQGISSPNLNVVLLYFLYSSYNFSLHYAYITYSPINLATFSHSILQCPFFKFVFTEICYYYLLLLLIQKLDTFCCTVEHRRLS